MLAVTLGGCAHGPLGTLPKVVIPEDANQVFVIRGANLPAATNSYKLTVDGQAILAMFAGEYTRFLLQPGRHTLGVRCFGGWSPTWKEKKIDVLLAPRTNSYFLVTPNNCAKIEPIADNDGLERIAKSEYVAIVQ